MYVRIGVQLYLDLPARAHAWAQREGLLLLPTEFESMDDLVLLSPEPESIFLIDPALPLDVQKVLFAVNGPDTVRAMTFYVDDEPYQVDNSAPFEVWWPLQVGRHEVYVEAETPTGAHASVPVFFTVRES